MLLPSGMTTVLRSIKVYDGGQKLWAVGDQGFIVHSNNSGSTWVEQQCEDCDPDDPIAGCETLRITSRKVWDDVYDVHFLESLGEGWLVGDGVVCYTADEGNNWRWASNYGACTCAPASKSTIYGAPYMEHPISFHFNQPIHAFTPYPGILYFISNKVPNTRRGAQPVG